MIVKAGIFDQDGVITDTAKIHFKAWKRMFDEYLVSCPEKNRTYSQPFTENDYLLYVDGKPRIDGITSFLKSRQIDIPLGSLEDSISDQTIRGLAKRKQKIFLDILHQNGIPLFQSTIEFIHDLHKNGIKTAVVSSSKNCEMILRKTGTDVLFETRVDGVILKELGLAGKPKPDMFLEAAKRLQVNPCDAFIVEDALSGVRAGHAGGFGFVIGVDRKGEMEEMFYDNGADIVLRDLSQINLSDITERMREKNNA